jgi:Mg/Co/Ni transporter MgtE
MNPDRFSLYYIEAHPEDAATALEGLNHEDLAAYLAALPVRHAALVVQHLTPISGAGVLALAPLGAATAILSALPAHQATALLRRVPDEKCHEILNQAELPAYIKRALRYPGDTVGAIMDADCLSLSDRFTVREARKLLKRHQAKIQNRLFVIDEHQQLKGFVELKEIMFAGHKTALAQLTRRPNIKLSARDRLVTAAGETAAEQTEVFPVVDQANRLMGVLTRKELQQTMAELAGDAIDVRAAGNDFLEVLDAIGDACAGILNYKDTTDAN